MNSLLVFLRYAISLAGWYARLPKRYLDARPLRRFKDIYKGERCFIIATGPSLTLEDVDMGFGEIYLLGADCNYKGKEKYGRDLAYESKTTADPAEVTPYMIECYKVAREYQDTHDVKIYNATRGGMLEVFERVDLDKVLGKG